MTVDVLDPSTFAPTGATRLVTGNISWRAKGPIDDHTHNETHDFDLGPCGSLHFVFTGTGREATLTANVFLDGEPLSLTGMQGRLFSIRDGQLTITRECSANVRAITSQDRASGNSSRLSHSKLIDLTDLLH
jgi:hypothetical protein